jgi:DNA-binding CsgD family transcriptional regulator
MSTKERSAKIDGDPGLETFSAVVEAIYDCALDPALWPHAIKQIADLSQSKVVLFAIHDYVRQHTELSVGLGHSDAYIKLYEEKYRAMNPFLPIIQTQPVGAVHTRAMVIDDAEFYESRFYKEWAAPQGWDDVISFNVLRTDRRVGLLAAHRLKGMARYGDAEIRILSLLAPHVCRSALISNVFNLEVIKRDALETALDALLAGVYLLDENCRICYMNLAARRQIEGSQALSVVDNRLIPVDRHGREALSTALQKMQSDGASYPGAATIAFRDIGTGGLAGNLLPLNGGKRRSLGSSSGAIAALFVQDPVVVPSFPGEAFAKIYNLTAGELRVLLALAQGLSAKGAAEILGISENTAKTHLNRIYTKTGTAKQLELMQLFLNSAPPTSEN